MKLPRAGAHRRSRYHGGPLEVYSVILIVSLALVTSIVALAVLSGSGEITTGLTGAVGPYSLNNSNRSVYLTFPTCSHVSVSWHLVTGSVANFSIWYGPLLVNSGCGGLSSGNATCPPTGCSLFGPFPACYESGASGNCWFVASQPSYWFYLYGNLDSSHPISVSFSAIYST
jgi:hypothetical protein